MKLIAITILFALTGCANSPISLAKMYDSNDPCQKTELIKTGQYPSFCGGGGTTYLTRHYNSNTYQYVTKVQK